MVDELRRRLELGEEVGEAVANRLELPDRLSERVPLEDYFRVSSRARRALPMEVAAVTSRSRTNVSMIR